MDDLPDRTRIVVIFTDPQTGLGFKFTYSSVDLLLNECSSACVTEEDNPYELYLREPNDIEVCFNEPPDIEMEFYPDYRHLRQAKRSSLLWFEDQTGRIPQKGTCFKVSYLNKQRHVTPQPIDSGHFQDHITCLSKLILSRSRKSNRPHTIFAYDETRRVLAYYKPKTCIPRPIWEEERVF